VFNNINNISGESGLHVKHKTIWQTVTSMSFIDKETIKKTRAAKAKNRIDMKLEVQKLFAQWEMNIQLVSDNCVEFGVCDSDYVSVLQYYRQYVLGFPMIFYVEEPITHESLFCSL
jgi:hypothetical protein